MATEAMNSLPPRACAGRAGMACADFAQGAVGTSARVPLRASIRANAAIGRNVSRILVGVVAKTGLSPSPGLTGVKAGFAK